LEESQGEVLHSNNISADANEMIAQVQKKELSKFNTALKMAIAKSQAELEQEEEKDENHSATV